MLVMSATSISTTQAVNLKRDHPFLHSQAQGLKPKPLSHFFFNPLSNTVAACSSSTAFNTFALFKAKTKAAPKKAAPKPKPKVEDGIFGTSGGIGFTKQNELFVGRVAMIGFAKMSACPASMLCEVISNYTYSFLIPRLGEENCKSCLDYASITEPNVRIRFDDNTGVMMQSYMQASLLGEAITGKGILAQLNLETGIPIYEAEPLLLFFILFTLLGAIGALGDRGRFVDEPSTGIEGAVIPPGKGIRSALGLKEGGPLFGFTKANELFVGRLAQLGIAFSLIGEIITGKGALAQLNIETGIPISEIEPLVLLNVAFFFAAAINPGTGKFITDEEEE